MAEEVNNNTNQNIESNNEQNSINEEEENEMKSSNNSQNNNNGSSLASEAKSAIMMEASTGKVIFEKNSHEKLPMASMTKMMTLLIIMENIKSGNLKWDEKVVTSEHAASMGGSQIFLEVGEEMTIEDLVKGICIGSGNDAAVAMAERIAGTEDDFVKMMNKKSQVLGLKDTHFVNSCGLDDDNHYSSASDMAVIARELVKYDKILEFTGTYEDYLRKNTNNSFWLVNTNKLVRYYKGVDGLKTGYTKSAGYCITTTAKKNNMRLITVVMGEPSSTVRNSETTSMLDYGFNTYRIDTVLSKKKIIATKKIMGGKDKNIKVVASDDINILNTKSGTKRSVKYKLSMNGIRAPLKKGDVVGNISVIENNKTIMNVDAVTLNEVKRANIFIVYMRSLLNMVKGTI